MARVYVVCGLLHQVLEELGDEDIAPAGFRTELRQVCDRAGAELDQSVEAT